MYSLCPHHLLPVEFKVHLAYIPYKKVLGLSKLVRLLQECNKGPLLQEKFTSMITKELKRVCPTSQGVACLIEGIHSCAKIRGVKTEGSFMTYNLTGAFLEDRDLSERFFQLLRR